MKIHTLSLLINPIKPEGQALVPRVKAACGKAGIRLVVEPADPLDDVGMPEESPLGPSDAVLVLGGDGTILRAIGRMHDDLRPVLGVNLGTLGFLAECMPVTVEDSIARLAAGDFWLEERMLIEARLEGEETVYTALNDFVVTRGSFSRMMDVDMQVDGMPAVRYTGDGAIIASPTGSTAYSLSAGGPIVSPDMACFVLTPICPHTLSSRPMVISAASEVRMALSPRGEGGGVLLAVDGIHCRTIREGAVLHVRRSKRTLPFVRFGENRFYALLQSKLSKWGGGVPQDDEYAAKEETR